MATASPPNASLYGTDAAYSTLLEPGKIVQSTKGPYLQTKIAAGDISKKFNLSIVDKDVLGYWSPDAITEAQVFLADFFIRELADSPLNGGGETTDQWWARNEPLMTEIEKPGVFDNLKVINEDGTSKSLPEQGLWQSKPEYAGFTYNYSKETPRVDAVKLVPTRVFLDNNKCVAGTYEAKYRMPYVMGEKSGFTMVSGTIGLSTCKGDDGSWLLNGHQSTTTSTSSGMK
ncbi:hypothetical protein CVS29_17430 [Arthrobacter psychrochitiniphilus]|uniref:Uncharacterized protein n=1 Tax=Arthrobacter psychrochitiniphilus TaxID=291045 RepID=A0A2V3DM71_9MICC|nr:hypothetical protein CVS29_17430 [Arthrobacter psychrochitiniphilus]